MATGRAIRNELRGPRNRLGDHELRGAGFMNDMIREKNGLFLPAADASVSFVDVRDIAVVAAEVLTRDGHQNKTYTITGGESFTHVITLDQTLICIPRPRLLEENDRSPSLR